MDERILLPIIRRWAVATDTGDRAELTDLPEICRSGRDCRRPPRTAWDATCPLYHDCFVTRMRQRAAESDLVIVNHHLLFADAAVRRALRRGHPRLRRRGPGRAHQLQDVATQYFGVTVSNYRAEDLARDASACCGSLEFCCGSPQKCSLSCIK